MTATKARTKTHEVVETSFILDRSDLISVLASFWDEKPKGRPSKARILELAAQRHWSDGDQFSWADYVSESEQDKAWEWAERIITNLWGDR